VSFMSFTCSCLTLHPTNTHKCTHGVLVQHFWGHHESHNLVWFVPQLCHFLRVCDTVHFCHGYFSHWLWSCWQFLTRTPPIDLAFSRSVPETLLWHGIGLCWTTSISQV
jgi:hypothetical protein